jgi:hypothetical protein
MGGFGELDAAGAGREVPRERLVGDDVTDASHWVLNAFSNSRLFGTSAQSSMKSRSFGVSGFHSGLGVLA